MRTKLQCDYENAIWQRAYEHFRLRLNERYQMDISFKQYVLLCKERVDKINYTSKYKCVGWLTIYGKKVLVAKETNRNKLLSTCLPANNIKNLNNESGA